MPPDAWAASSHDLADQFAEDPPIDGTELEAGLSDTYRQLSRVFHLISRARS